MRNPTLHLVGIATSPESGEGGSGVFNIAKAEEELRHWLETRLDALGIDPVAYSRFVLSLLRRPDSAFAPPTIVVTTAKGSTRHSRARSRSKLPFKQQGDREQKRAVIQCLTSAADHKCGVEPLVDELCEKLRDLEGEDSEEKEVPPIQNSKTALEFLTPRDRALRYYAAFPALQPVVPKKFLHKKDHTFAMTNINNNNNSCSNRNKNVDQKNNNNKSRSKKTKISINIDDQQRTEGKVDYGFAKSMELEREKDQDLYQLRLAQLKAKFNWQLEALWDSSPGNNQTTDIWAAPSLSIPSGPAWPTDTSEAPVTLPASNGNTPCQEHLADESPLIPLDIEWFNIEDKMDEEKNIKSKNIDAPAEGPWSWRGFSGNFANWNQSPSTNVDLFTTAPGKNVAAVGKESRPKKANHLPDPDEDLLTSARTHFRPIKEDGLWADGTTFPVNNNVERVTYRRSESGNLLYLPGGESPYMEYRENAPTLPAASANLALKFRVRQCDKYVQTDPWRSPVKRRILSEDEKGDEDVAANEDAFENEPNDLGDDDDDEDDDDDFAMDGLDVEQAGILPHNERKRKHSSSYRCCAPQVPELFSL